MREILAGAERAIKAVKAAPASSLLALSIGLTIYLLTWVRELTEKSEAKDANALILSAEVLEKQEKISDLQGELIRKEREGKEDAQRELEELKRLR